MSSTHAPLLFSREVSAGYDREAVARGAVALVGCGAAGQNIALNLALSGVGELRLIDHDHLEPSNFTRSPMVRREALFESGVQHKAKEVARGFLARSYADDPVVRFAIAKVESLGFGAFLGAHVIVSAVDSFGVRAYLADVARLLGIPLIELGFRGSEGHVSVFPNAAPGEPCWRCLHPLVDHGGVSCSTYARAVVAEGGIPAIQTAASALGSIAAEASIQALHGHFPLGNKVCHLDIRSGRSHVVDATLDPLCPGVHRRHTDVQSVDVRASDRVEALLDHAAAFTHDPVLLLPGPFVVHLPCARCGAPMHLMKPAWALPQAPTCASCPAGATPGGEMTVVTSVMRGAPLARTALKKVGIAPASLVEIQDDATGHVAVLRLAGGVDELFITKRRTTRNGEVESRMNGANTGTRSRGNDAAATETP